MKKKEIKVGDWVIATKDCGLTKKGNKYQVVWDDLNGQGQKYEGCLAINPTGTGANHRACTEIETWKLIKV